MDVVICPHCKSHRIVTAKVPRDVVVVMPCPSCHELAVLFRNKVIALSRRIIEHGSFEERKMHLAHVIAEFLEAGMLPFKDDDGNEEEAAATSLEGLAELRQDVEGTHRNAKPISDQELEQFARFDLKHIDNAAYFKKYFG
jgi:hypothetical protein